MKLEEAIQKVSEKLSLNEMLWWNHKSEHPGSTLKILKCFTKHEKQLFDDSFTIASKAKYKTIHGEGIKILTP